MNGLIDIPKEYRPKGAVHPATGEPIVGCVQWNAVRDVETFNTLPPTPPSRELWKYDDDDNQIFVRNLTNKEFASATRAFERESKRWFATLGVVNTPGPITVTGTFVSESGVRVSGRWTGKGWAWDDWEIPDAELQPATCDCGHEGKSRNPRHYRCTACYHESRAKSSEQRAADLLARAKRLADGAKKDRATAKAFRKRHPSRKN
jgi:hypothetical protein